MEDLIGKKFGMLTIINTRIIKTQGKNRVYSRMHVYCKCDCGTEKWMRFDSIKAGKVKGCGCLASIKNDLEGKRFGELVAIKPMSGKDGTKWLCQCDCGNESIVYRSNLLQGKAKTCGHGSDIVELSKNNSIDGTNVTLLARKKANKNNKSGIIGVTWDSRKSKWRAVIMFKGQHTHIGYFDKIEDAKKARQQAEEKLHETFLKEKGLID